MSDGSVLDEHGKVLFFSVERFIRDIVEGDCCFICGVSPQKAEFNQEHILPDWILGRYDLHDKQINLPNKAGFMYGRYTIPCCKQCNSLMSDVFETPISRLHSQGSNAISGYTRDNGPWLIFRWLSLIFLKTHLKDTALRLHLDSRKSSEKLADLYTWEDLHHIYCVARSFYTGAKLEAPVLGSMMVLPSRTGTPLGDFDYSDLYAPKTMLLRLGEIVIVAALMDSCAAFNLTLKMLEKITGFISPLQAREIMTHFAFINLHLQDRPDFFSEFKPSQNEYVITAQHPPQVKLNHTQEEDFGKILYECCGPAIERLKVAGEAEIVDSIKAGRRSFLFDNDGLFIQNSI